MTDTLGAGTRLADRYEIEEVIGRGRSPVYRARDTRLGRAVAVKEVGLAVGADATGRADRARALREARSAARVLSPSAVQVYDVVEERSAVWLVMELVRAPSLDRLVAEGGPLDEVRAALAGVWVLDALAAAHGQDVVHRDVRPANVLVGDLHDPALDVPVKLADFGLAALRDDTSVTAPGAISGSPAFTAPEQAAGRKAGPSSDLWALGAVLYFAVEGQPPFAGESPADVAAAVAQGEARPAQRLDRLGRIVEMLLDPQPERRPDAGRVRAVLRSVATGTEPGDDTLEAPSPAGPALAAAAAAGAAAAGAVAGDPTAVAGAAAGDATAVADTGGPAAATGAGVADPAAVAGGPTAAPSAGDSDRTPVTGAPAVVAGAGGTSAGLDGAEPTGAHGRVPGGREAPAPAGARRGAPVPFLVAAAAAALLALAGLAVVQGRGGGEPQQDPARSPVTTVETTTTEPPETDGAEPADPGAPPASAPADGGEAPADAEPSEGDEGPGATAPETTTTAPPEDTTTTPTTEPPATTTTAPPTTDTPTTTAGTDTGAGGGAATLTMPGVAALTSPGA